MLAQDRRLTLRLIAEDFGIRKDTANTIVRDDLGNLKIFSRFVPLKLTDEQNATRMATSGDFISTCDQDPLLLENIVTGDEAGAISSIRKQNSNRWRGAHRLIRDQKESSAKIEGQNTVDRLLRQQRHHP